MIKKLIPGNAESVLQEAIHAELYASHLYKHIANQLQRIGFFGAAKYFKHESAEELEHYQKLADYLNDVGYVAELPEIEACEETVASLQDAIELAYSTEVSLMQKYARWYEAVDVVTKQRLLEFIEVQRVSVGVYGDYLARLKQAGDCQAAILMIDNELGQ